MKKRAYFYVDDVILCLKDLTKEKPLSLFDNSFFKGLKDAHEKYGVKVQLNLFYSQKDFSLADVTDAYKEEFASNSDWLKFGFCAKQEGTSYISADYETVKNDFTLVRNEVLRFATNKNFTFGTSVLGTGVSQEGCKALKDCGVKILNAISTDEETTAYNNLTSQRKAEELEVCDLFYSKDTYLYFKEFLNTNDDYYGYFLNEKELLSSNGLEKMLSLAKTLNDKGYEHFFIEELADEQPIRKDPILPQLVMWWENDGTEPIYPTLPEGVEVVNFTNLENAKEHWMRIISALTSGPVSEGYYKMSTEQVHNFSKDYCFFILVDGKPIATSSVIYNYAKEGEGLIHMVACLDEAKGKGIGNLLSKLMLYYLKKGGMKTARLSTNDFRLAAIKTYLNIGYTPDVSTIDFEQRWEKILKTLANYKKNK